MLPRRGYVEFSEAYTYANDVYKAAVAIDDLTEAGEHRTRSGSRVQRSPC